jgi:hypothetical protein
VFAKELAVSYPNTFGELVDLHGAKLARHIDSMFFHRSAEKIISIVSGYLARETV